MKHMLPAGNIPITASRGGHFNHELVELLSREAVSPHSWGLAHIYGSNKTARLGLLN